MRKVFLASAAVAVAAATAAAFHCGMFAATAKTLRCEMTIISADSFVWKGAVQTIPVPPQTLTVVWQIDGDRWTGLSVNGRDPASMVRESNAEFGQHRDVSKNVWSPLKVTEQTYVLWDRASSDNTDFLSIDRTTGDVSGSSHSVTGSSTFQGRTTGHCTSVSTPIL
jgi:hypothetical protein